MTRESDAITTERWLVVVFDIRYSTKILEDLKQTDNLRRWRNLLLHMRDVILMSALGADAQVYKFIGDGWILFFPMTTKKEELKRALWHIADSYEAAFKSQIGRFLQHRIEKAALTFGVDAGELVKAEMHGRVEFLGRAINVASRLQSEAKKSKNSQNTVLITKHAYNALPSDEPRQRPLHVKVSLRHVLNGENYECYEYDASTPF